jgi:ABC-type transporter Mla MlaB component
MIGRMAFMARDAAVPVRPGEHACCRFAAAADRWRIAVGVVRDGLRRGHGVLYLCDRDDVDVFARELAGLDAAIERALARGQVRVCSSAEAYVPDGRFDVERMLGWLSGKRDRARAEGYAGITITGELGDAFCSAGGEEIVEEYERRLDEMGFASTVCLCQYDHARFGAGTVSAVAESHDVDLAPELAPIGREGALAAARLRSGALRLAGELDFECAPTVADVLDAHFHGPLSFDLADLSYVDVSGMRALRGRTGQPLAIAGASEPVRRLLELLAWDTDPGVELLEGE